MTGAYFDVVVSVEEQKALLPGCRVQVWPLKKRKLDELLAVPVCDVALYSQTVGEPWKVSVNFQSVPVSVTWPLELTDMLPGATTVVVATPRLEVQVCGVLLLPIVSPVHASVAVPGDAGFVPTDAAMFDALQVMLMNPDAHVMLVPDASPAVITSPTAASVPPTLPTVSTSDAAAGATPIPRVAASPLARNEARVTYLRMFGGLLGQADTGMCMATGE
jgi:hypothetical protein